jgi:hypothetical protein
LKLLAGLYGIDSIIKKEPDVILKVRDAARAQVGLTGAPGSLRVIDERTVYLRMPPGMMEADIVLMVLRNLLKAAHERGDAAPMAKPAQPTLVPSKGP